METPVLELHIDAIRNKLSDSISPIKTYGKVTSVVGTIIECTGLQGSVGEMFGIHTSVNGIIPAEVVGLKDGKTLLMPFDRVTGMKSGCLVEVLGQSLNIPVGDKLLGRVLDTNGSPIDKKGNIFTTHQQPVYNNPP